MDQLFQWIKLLRWNKPSGRLILLIPAGWSLWLTPNSPPDPNIVFLIFLGGIFVSGAGCIANDLWDRNFDQKVERTKNRPLANKKIRTYTAINILIVMLVLSLLTVLLLPIESRRTCITLSVIALPLIILYPSAKRWFKYPQAFLSICWGFSVLIPWAASESNLNGGIPLLTCWAATITWTFGFDTVYAIADCIDDKKLGLNSSAISLNKNVINSVRFSYLLTCIFLAISAYYSGVNGFFWPIWVISITAMHIEVSKLNKPQDPIVKSSNHFKNQVLIGSIILFGFIFSNI